MRRLALKKETLAELGAADLAHVVGGAATKDGCLTNEVRVCFGTVNCSHLDTCVTAQGCLTDGC